MGRLEVAAVAVAGAALALLRLRDRARRRERLAGHAKVSLLPNERGAIICMSPSTSTVTFFQGSLDEAAKKLAPRVAAIVRANPWLAAVLDDDESGELAAFVPPDAAEKCCFEVRDDVSLRRDAPYVTLVDALAPVLVGTSLEARGTGAPLWRVSLVPIARRWSFTSLEGAYALVVSANHSLLDGHGYYQIFNMLSDGAPVEALRAERKAELPGRIVEAMGGEVSLMQQNKPGFLARFIGGQVRNALFPATAFHGFYVDGAWLAARKREAADGVPYVSTNDCVVSEFCSTLGCDLALMAINFRGKVEGCGDADCGNYEDLIAYTPADYATPALVRKSIAGAPYFRATAAPLPTNLGHLTAQYGAVTNWSTFAKPLVVNGFDQDLHLPLLDWNASTPASVFGAMVIFTPKKGAIAAFVAGSRAFVERAKASGMVGTPLEIAM